MDAALVEVASNWTQTAGCEFRNALQIQNANPDVFVKPSLDELVLEDKAVLLSKLECSENCELSIKLHPHYKIQSFSLVCTANKMEIFQGGLKEYLETVYGTVVEGCIDEELRTYRYDVEVEKSGITELIMKFLSPSEELCLFGIAIQTAPNPNGITTLLPNTSAINYDRVKELLKGSATSPAASEKCKELLLLMARANKSTNELSTNANIEMPNIQQLLQQQCQLKRDTHLHKEEAMITAAADVRELKSYIDTRLQEMEERLNQRLAEMAKRNEENFNHVIRLLSAKDSLE